MDLVVDKHIKTPLYKQIVNQLEQMILSGELPTGYILPPERKLADQLEVNRTTVLNAYRTLKADGLLISRMGQGTMVDYVGEENSKVKKQFLPMRFDHLYANIGKYKMSNYEKQMLKFTGDVELISFSVGILAPEGYPFQEDTFERLYREQGKRLLNHTMYQGLPELKSEMMNYLKPYNIKCNQKELMITSGSQQGISLIADIFVEAGDVVIVEDPTYFLGKEVFEQKGARIIGIPMEQDGMDIRYLEQVLKTTKAKIIYTMPNQQNPTNYTMSVEKKARLLQLAYEYQVVILEDGAYNDLCFNGKKPVTLKSMDYNQQVIYIGTFSKVFSLGLRVGFMIGSKEVIERVSYIKHLRDIHTSSISQWMVYDQLKSGNLYQYVNLAIVEHQEKLAYCMETMQKLGYGQYDIHYDMPEGGIYLWMQLPDELDANKLFEIAIKKGVVYAPGQLFSNTQKYEHYIRFNFVYVDKTKIHEGLKRLLEAIKEGLNEQKGDIAVRDDTGFAAI